MADETITALTLLAAGSVDSTADVIPIVDVSANATKKITVASLLSLAASGVPVGLRSDRPAANAGVPVYIAYNTGEIFASNGTSWFYIEGAASTSVIAQGGQPANGGYVWVNTHQSVITLPLNTVVSDPGGNFNAATGIYTVPVTGTYQIFTKVKLADSTPANTGYGIGAGLASASDYLEFFTSTAASPARNNATLPRLAALTAGDQIRIACYIESPTDVSISGAQLNITLSSL